MEVTVLASAFEPVAFNIYSQSWISEINPRLLSRAEHT